ncbi:MAG: type II toxin-antitoxin system VapC family toxin [Chloroflexi bacterium]|nr:type II toxin-antitoxin system VapC family toxin [Chloroflexota bacterium]
MTVLYADTSALVRAYLADEPDHDVLRPLLLESHDVVVTSEIARVGFAGAVYRAARAGRVERSEPFVDRFDLDCGAKGPIALLRFERDAILALARRLVLAHPVGTLDAIHLAAALSEAAKSLPDSELVFITRDDGQAAAARSLGLEVR